ncbi:electron transfer flavoprotein subunit alpha/FixB family protein [Myxococcota bacterium]|nr:electron transfer flavoprotein subunit alpha/FixB family protein [Myxococcota bacterium]
MPNFLVYCEHTGGAPRRTAQELVSKAKELAGGGDVSAVLVGSGLSDEAASLGGFGASKVFLVEADALAEYSAEGYTRALCDLIEDLNPDVVLAAASPVGKDLLPRVAARSGAGLATDCIDLAAGSQGAVKALRPLYAGKARAWVEIVTPRQFFTVRPNSFPVPAAGAGAAEVDRIAAQVEEADLRARVVEKVSGGGAKVDLTEADRIVAGGRSLKSAEGFQILEEMADVIGATVGASRAAVDAGFVPHSMQVGQTGKTVNPTLYIAVGISGAIQHLAGMRTSKVIVAINKDPEAPIFQKSTYGIVADLFEAVPALTAEFRKALRD